MLQDAPCRINFEKKRYGIVDSDESIPNFQLSSIYKPIGVSPLRYVVDQNGKSPVPVLSMRKEDYFMLGEKMSESSSLFFLLALNQAVKYQFRYF